jgi:hypothetical protein
MTSVLWNPNDGRVVLCGPRQLGVVTRDSMRLPLAAPSYKSRASITLVL